MSLVLTGMKKYTIFLGDSAAVATAFAAKPWAQALISAGALAGLTSVLLVFQLGQPRIFMAMARDGLLPRIFRAHPPALSHALHHDDLDRRGGRRSGDADRHRFARGSDEHRNALRVRSGLPRGDRAAPERSEPAAAFPRSASSRVSRFSACSFAARSCSVCRSKPGCGSSSGW